MQETNPAAGQSSARKQPAASAAARDGVLVVDKPAQKTSAWVVNRIKRLPGVAKAGHTGTLDPFATGVLICPVNRATRLSRFFLHGRKKYTGVLRLGEETDTLDRTGRIIAAHAVPDLTEEHVQQVFQEFTGKIEQVPPAFSALKHNGVPLYKYARAGTPVEKPPRTVEINEIRLTYVALPDIGFEVTCSGGTYIRTLCADIGKALGCGAHLHELARTASGGFGLAEASGLDALESACAPGDLDRFIVPMSAALRGMPAYTADAALAEKIRHGRQILDEDLRDRPADGGDTENCFIKITDSGDHLLAVIEKPRDKFAYSYCCVFYSNG